jgi:hypothetical protein
MIEKLRDLIKPKISIGALCSFTPSLSLSCIFSHSSLFSLFSKVGGEISKFSFSSCSAVSSSVTDAVEATKPEDFDVALVDHLRDGGGHSDAQISEQPSSDVVFPSSHASSQSITPSPHTAN